jgi:tetratricopeptide (TPR) repeat protein
MKARWIAAALFLWLAGPLLMQGQSADDKYLRVYGLLEQAERLNEAGQTRSAVTKYLEAQVALKELQQAHSGWNAKLVEYRLEDISARLELLTKKSSAATPKGKDAPPPGPSPGGELKMMQEDIARLASQNAMLEARLREALSVQPAAIDPRELAKAEEKIKTLQKERDLLVVSLQQAGAKTGSSPPGKETSVDARQNLVTQTAVVSVLQKQNEELQKQITDLAAKLKLAGRSTTSNDETLKLKETIAALEASNRVMKEEQTAMENRLLDFVRQHGPAATAARTGALEKQLAEARQAAKAATEERDALIQKLNDVTRQLNQRDARASAAATQQLEQQLEAIRAKVQIFEAKQVPFSADELALFKQAPIKVAAAQTNAPAVTNKSSAAPPGAAQLVVEAQRAVAAERFDEAERKYRDALRQDENNTHLLANLGAVQLDQDKTADAEATLKKAIELDPQDPVSLYLMGGVKLRQEKFDEAIETLSLSAKLDPEKANTQYFLGKALIQMGSRGPAETALRKAVQLKPGWGDAHYLLAVLYATQEPNFKELAQYHYKKAIAGGAARNPELEQWMTKAPASAKR